MEKITVIVDQALAKLCESYQFSIAFIRSAEVNAKGVPLVWEVAESNNIVSGNPITISFDHKYYIYDRLQYSVTSAPKKISLPIDSIQQIQIGKELPADVGDSFVIIDKQIELSGRGEPTSITIINETEGSPIFVGLADVELSLMFKIKCYHNAKIKMIPLNKIAITFVSKTLDKGDEIIKVSSPSALINMEDSNGLTIKYDCNSAEWKPVVNSGGAPLEQIKQGSEFRDYVLPIM